MPTKVSPYFLSVLCLITLATAQLMVRAQGAGEDLQTFSPVGEEFSVDMPKDPKVQESQETYHRMTLNTRLYLSATDHGPVYAVASLSGIKGNSAMYTELQRLNSYVDAFKNWFPQKVKGKDTIAKLTVVGDKVLNGNPGREYKVVIGDLSGTAQMYTTRRRFYAVVILNTKKDDALTERFLSSLNLPEKAATPAAAVVATTPTAGATARTSKTEPTDETAKTEGTPTPATAESKPGESTPSEKAPGERAPISGGVLNGKAVYLPQPEYPAIAAQAHASGMVAVQVLIDEVGNVISAHAISGHPLLQAVSVAAARQARFAPTSLMGEPVKVNGVIQYNFVAR